MSENILKEGITLFVCLMEKSELERFNPYIPVVKSINSDVRFINFEIEDNYIADDKLVLNFIDILYEEFKKGTIFYVHCWGGHGRTGTIVAVLLAKIFGISADEALEKTGLYHSCRTVVRERSPQTSIQFKQVRRLIPLLQQNKLENYESQ